MFVNGSIRFKTTRIHQLEEQVIMFVILVSCIVEKVAGWLVGWLGLSVLGADAEPSMFLLGRPCQNSRRPF